MNRHVLIFLDKTLFQCVFYIVTLFVKSRKTVAEKVPVPVPKQARVLVIRPGGIGDGLMSLPFLRAVRKTFPDGKISLICLNKNKLAYQHVSTYDELIILDDPRALLKTLRSFFRGEFDIVFDLEPFRKVSAIVALISRAHIRIGFDTNTRRALYTHLISYANEKVYESKNMLRQLDVFGTEYSKEESENLSFSLPDAALDVAGEMLVSRGIDPNHFILVVVPGVLKKHHRWNMAHFSKCIDLVCQEDDRVKIILMGVPADEQDAMQVMAQVRESHRIENMVGVTNYTESLAILSMCDILLACDGGIVYMAAAMGVSTISLWGPGVMARFKPPGDKHIGIKKSYPCVPCVNYSRLGEFPGCPYDRMCMNDIVPEDVFEAYIQLKSETQSKAQTIGDVQIH